VVDYCLDILPKQQGSFSGSIAFITEAVSRPHRYVPIMYSVVVRVHELLLLHIVIMKLLKPLVEDQSNLHIMSGSISSVWLSRPLLLM